MNPANGNSWGLDRQASTRRSMAMSDVTDDDYDLNAMAVSDGFRPDDASSTTAPQRSATTPSTETTATPPSSRSSPLVPPPTLDLAGGIPPKLASDMQHRPSSISKAHRPHDSLTLRNDGLGAGAAGSFVPGPAHAANASHIIRMESPFQGPSGPSHPYTMYPQRTLSNVTLSTDVSSLAPSQNGPAHPYALYTQHTTPVQEGSQQHIPLGFTAMAGGYQRQLGPDGEDAGGLIGPLGHTEELPPYTRYPTEAYTRSPEAGTPITTPGTGTDAHASPSANANASTTTGISTLAASSTRNPSIANPIPGAGGIGMATRNPEFSSTDEDLPRPRSNQSTRSTPSEASQHEINTAAQEMAEKPRMTKWQRRARKKMCGIVPYWAICLLFSCVVIMASVMAGVLTTFLGIDGGSEEETEEYTGPPSPVMPSPLPYLPPDLAPLAVGSFGLPLMEPSQASRSCFNDSTQAQAWNCNIPGRTFSMNVSMIPNASEIENYELSLAAVDPFNSRYIWGTAPPNVSIPISLKLVNDSFEPSRSPAWWLKIAYNKTVIVSENDFKTASSPSKRDWTYTDFPDDGFGPTHFKKKSTSAVDGDKPWICTWPETTLEIFIYPSQNSSLVMTTTTTGFPAPTSTATSPSETPPPGFAKPYPRMIKFLERRQSFDFDPPPYCRQVEVYSNGHKDRPVLDEFGRPVIVEIVENDRVRLMEKLANNDKRGDLGAMKIRDNGLELTDCGCLWWMT